MLAEPSTLARGPAVEELGRVGFPVVVAIGADAPAAALISFYAAPDDDDALVEAVAATWTVKVLAGWDESPVMAINIGGTGRLAWYSARGIWGDDRRWSLEVWPLRRGAWRGLVEELQPGLALALADIDHLKAFNDQYGITDGELAIARVHACIESVALAAGATFTRVAGDAFAVVAPTVDEAARLAELARRDVEAMAIPLAHAAVPSVTRLTVSVGVVPVRDPGTVADEAERALYEAKRGGRNRVWRADD